MVPIIPFRLFLFYLVVHSALSTGFTNRRSHYQGAQNMSECPPPPTFFFFLRIASKELKEQRVWSCSLNWINPAQLFKANASFSNEALQIIMPDASLFCGENSQMWKIGRYSQHRHQKPAVCRSHCLLTVPLATCFGHVKPSSGCVHLYTKDTVQQHCSIINEPY